MPVLFANVRVYAAAARDLDMEAQANCAGSSGAGPSGAGCSKACGSGASVADADNIPGMRVYLSQIKEWLLEIAADMVFIVVRTDCAWYKVRTVHPAYEGWFGPILKVARLAVHILGAIQGETRSSRLSFTDIVKQLSLQPTTAPTFIATKPDLVCDLFIQEIYHTWQGGMRPAVVSIDCGDSDHYCRFHGSWSSTDRLC